MGTYSQAQRKFRVETSLGADALLLESFEGEEAVSTPYLFTLNMVSEDPEIDPDALLRQPAAVVLELPDGSERNIHGRIRRFVQLERTGLLTRYRAELVPWSWFLSLSSDCRIFQEMSVPDIVAQVFGDLGFSDFENRCTGTYATRDYCVQYRETTSTSCRGCSRRRGSSTSSSTAPTSTCWCSPMRPARSSPAPGRRRRAWWNRRARGNRRTCSRAWSSRCWRAPARWHSPTTTISRRRPACWRRAPVPTPEEHYDYPGDYGVRDDGERYSRLELESREVAAAGAARAGQPAVPSSPGTGSRCRTTTGGS